MDTQITTKQLRPLLVNYPAEFTKQQIEQLVIYANTLFFWNSKMNLISKMPWQKMVSNLFADSFYLANFMEQLKIGSEQTIFDIGAGAGLPGIPYRICHNIGYYHLIEPRKKRSIFLEECIWKLKLKQTYAKCQRLEDIKEKVDFVISRAFCPWVELFDRLLPILKPTGIIITMTSDKINPPQFWHQLNSYEYIIAEKQRYLGAFNLG